MKLYENTEVKMLNSKTLVIDHTYQHPLNKRRVQKIANNFDPAKLGLIEVSYRDGKYYVYDGQHRLTAAILHNDGKDLMVRCLVHYGMTLLDEVHYFTDQDANVGLVSTADKLRAKYNIGDPEVVEMANTIGNTGWEINWTNSTAGKYRITAVKTIYDAYRTMPRDQFSDMLILLKNAWSGSSDSVCRDMIIGMQRFFSVYYGEFDQKNLAKKLSRIPPIDIIREGRSIGRTSKGGTTYARIILRIYNESKRNPLPDKL